MKKLLLVLFLIYGQCCFSQTLIEATIKDSKTKETLSYCNVSIKGTYKGTISNADGVFSISVNSTNDILVFSYLGYESISISAEVVLRNPVILLVKKDMIIEEVVVHAGNDYLYDIMVKCRNRLLDNKESDVAKVYYGIETKTKEQPVELLECYYTGILKGVRIEELQFKNGRVALATVDSNYFETFNTAKALSKLNLTKKNDYYPSVPLEFGKNEMKKHFELEIQDFDNSMFHLKFSPKNDKDCFAGEIWIEKGSFNMLKITLNVDNAKIHPFEPMHSFDSLYDVSLSISNNYKIENNKSQLDHISFDYNFKYKSVRDTSVASCYSKDGRVLTRDIFSKGVIRLYDYNNPFIVPYFEYPDDLYYGDYYRMSFIPYNKVFWSNTNTMLLTEEQKKDLGFFYDKGKLINYISDDNYGSNFLASRESPNSQNQRHFEYYYSFWSKDKRVVLHQGFKENSSDYTVTAIQSDLYKLKVQILLDATQLDDSIYCRTFTVFDPYQSFYYLKHDEYTNAFINIYFDICEIERRKLEEQLLLRKYTPKQIDMLYKKSEEDMDNITKLYLKEVSLGKNIKLFKKWNQYVIDKLSIDNIGMVEETNKSKQE